MKDLRIVIVSWNVEHLLDRCLRSLPDACRGIDWECVVVDNASHDDSVETTQRVAQTVPQIRMIANDRNVGFAKACNQGTVESCSRYLLFLNPDTLCPPDSLAQFVRLADQRPRAGILGPQLVNPDGTIQPSIRRFPDVWSQAGILLKLHHLFPGWKIFQRYFAKDVSLETEQRAEQVMGACFLIRRECWNDIGPFDERFFIWFEEVDRCKAAIDIGWDVLYLPQIHIVHHGAASFTQVFSPKKQKYFNQSLIAYFNKWHPGWRVTLLKFFAHVSLREAWAIELLRRPVVAWSLFVVALECISAATIFRPAANSLATFILGIVIMLLAWKKPVAALGILLAELLIGSKGQLLQFGEWPVTISLRMVITGMFLLGWALNVIQKKRWSEIRHTLHGRAPYFLLAFLIFFAFLRGFAIGNGSFVMQDGNAWFDWLLFIPVLDVANTYRASLRRSIVPLIFICIFWIAFKTLALEYLFSHGFPSISPRAYLWVRRTGVGEVTHVLGNAFRIFMQSYVYAVAAWIMAAAWWMGRGQHGIWNMEYGIWNREDRAKQTTHHSPLTTHYLVWVLMCATTVILAISLSRSFWIGTSVGLVTLLVILSRARIEWWRRLWGPISAKLAALFLIGAVLAFPIPPVQVASLFELFGSRASLGESAVVSRWNLLPILVKKIGEHPILGSGFGATVTYETSDPRILREHPDGRYTTYAFEWGWLEHWVKFGILGIPILLWILISLGRRLWRVDEPLWLRAGAVSSLMALGAIHIFTPYLNHPLGFLFLFIGEGIVQQKREPPDIYHSGSSCV